MASSSQQSHDKSNDKDYDFYTPLYKAAVRGDWVAAQEIFKSDPPAMSAKINYFEETALHIAVRSGQTEFVKKLVELIPSVEVKNRYDETPLHSSAQVGDTEAAKAMVQKNPNLLQIKSKFGRKPIHEAIKCSNKDLVEYLCYEDPSPFQGNINDAVNLLIDIIYDGFYDVALDILQRFPHLATGFGANYNTALKTMAKKSSAFQSGSRFVFWQRCIYKWIPVDVGQVSTPHRRIEGATEDPPRNSSDRLDKSIMQQFLKGIQIIQVSGSWKRFFWNAIKHLVPSIKKIHDAKLMHAQSLEIVKCICAQVTLLGKYTEIMRILGGAALLAAKFGTVEVIHHCLQSYPDVIWHNDPKTSHSMLHIAIRHRQEKVFKLLRGFHSHTKILALWEDSTTKNGILHLAAKLAPSRQLDTILGVALQMQRELQWYKVVERIVQPKYIEHENIDMRTPPVLFIEEHMDLVKNGERWMKEISASCMVIATLIATVSFTAAFTIPGGNNEYGMPFFLKSKCFMIFAIANALALFSSSISVLIFLSTFTSRYAEEDFFKPQLKKLIIGFSTMFLSITNMMIAFSATCFIVLGHQLAWVSILIALLASFPISFFALSYFELFVEMIITIYNSDIF